MPRGLLARAPCLSSQDAEFALREVRLLQQVEHPNVVKLLEAYQARPWGQPGLRGG